MIPYGRQDISEADIKAVVDVLRSEFLTQGPAIVRFEDAIATRVGARSAVAMNSATSALHAAVAALGLDLGMSFGPVQSLSLPLPTARAIAARK